MNMIWEVGKAVCICNAFPNTCSHEDIKETRVMGKPDHNVVLTGSMDNITYFHENVYQLH
jgi:hypothetical protein